MTERTCLDCKRYIPTFLSGPQEIRCIDCIYQNEISPKARPKLDLQKCISILDNPKYFRKLDRYGYAVINTRGTERKCWYREHT